MNLNSSETCSWRHEARVRVVSYAIVRYSASSAVGLGGLQTSDLQLWTATDVTASGFDVLIVVLTDTRNPDLLP